MHLRRHHLETIFDLRSTTKHQKKDENIDSKKKLTDLRLTTKHQTPEKKDENFEAKKKTQRNRERGRGDQTLLVTNLNIAAFASSLTPSPGRKFSTPRHGTEGTLKVYLFISRSQAKYSLVTSCFFEVAETGFCNLHEVPLDGWPGALSLGVSTNRWQKRTGGREIQEEGGLLGLRQAFHTVAALSVRSLFTQFTALLGSASLTTVTTEIGNHSHYLQQQTSSPPIF